MSPAHWFGVWSGRIPKRMSTPTIGRSRLLGSGLRASRFGLPVAGSLGSLSHWIRPHKAAPQLARRTWDLPPSVNHVPLGSPASAGPVRAVARPRATHRAFAEIVVMHSRAFSATALVVNFLGPFVLQRTHVASKQHRADG